MLLTRSSASAEVGSRGFEVVDSGGVSGTGASSGVVIFESVAPFSMARTSLFLASSSALFRQMFSIFANLRGPHLWKS